MKHLLCAALVLGLVLSWPALAAEADSAAPAQTASPAVSVAPAVASSASSAAGATPAEAPLTVESLIEIAAAKCAAARDISVQTTIGAVGRVGRGSLKILLPDRLIFLTEFTEKAGDKEQVVTTMRIVRNKNLLYVEQTGKGVDRPGVVLIDLARVAELRKQGSPLAARLESVRPPAYEAYLKDAATEGIVFKVLKAEGDLVTVEGTNPRYVPGSRQPARVVATISRTDGFPRSIRHYGELGNLLDFIEFSKVTFDAGLKSSDLDYAPPKELPVTDWIDYLKTSAGQTGGAAKK
jgi:hypothetical protein